MSICQIIKNNKDVLNLNLASGWNLIKIEVNEDMFGSSIIDIRYEGESIQELIYCSWFESQGNVFQPCTEFWDQKGTWCIWLHSSIAITIDHYRKQINNNDFGTDLSKNYHIVYDRSIDIDREFPLSIREFFSHSFGPLYYKKDNVRNIPAFRYDHGINVDAMFESLKSYRIEPDNAPYTKSWKTNKIQNPEDNEYIRSIMTHVNMYEIRHAGYYTLGPKGYIPLHRDDLANEKLDDKWKIYFAKQPGSLFKLDKAGVLDINDNNKSFILDTHTQVHSVVNITDSFRDVIVLNGYCDKDKIRELFNA